MRLHMLLPRMRVSVFHCSRQRGIAWFHHDEQDCFGPVGLAIHHAGQPASLEMRIAWHPRQSPEFPNRDFRSNPPCPLAAGTTNDEKRAASATVAQLGQRAFSG